MSIKFEIPSILKIITSDITVTGNLIVDGYIINPSNAIINQVLKYNGSSFIAQDEAGTGNLHQSYNIGNTSADQTLVIDSAHGNHPIFSVSTVNMGQVPGLALVNTTPATAGNQKYAPMLEMGGFGWQTTAGGASGSQKLGLQNRTVQATLSATPGLDLLQSNGNNGSSGAWMKYGSLRPLSDTSIPSGGMTIAGWKGTPGAQLGATAISLVNGEIYFGVPDSDAAGIGTNWFYMIDTGFQPFTSGVSELGQSGRRWTKLNAASANFALDATNGGVLLNDSSDELNDFLFRVANNDNSYVYLDVNPFESSVQFGFNPSNESYNISIGGTPAIAFGADNTYDIGRSDINAHSVFTGQISAGTLGTLKLRRGASSDVGIDMSGTTFNPVTDLSYSMGSDSVRYLSYTFKLGTFFNFGLHAATAPYDNGLLMKGKPLTSSYPGSGVVEWSPPIEFAQSYGQTSDPESGYATARMALQGRMSGNAGGSVADNRIAFLSDGGVGTYAEVASLRNAGEFVSSYARAIGISQLYGILLENTTAATSGAGNQKWSPGIQLSGRQWNSSASVPVDWMIQAKPITGLVTAGSLSFQARYNGGSWSEPFSFTAGAIPTITGNTDSIRLLDNNGNGFAVAANLPQVFAGGVGQWQWYSSYFIPTTDFGGSLGLSSFRMTETWSRRYAGVEQTIAAAATITLDPALGETIRITLGATGITTVNGTVGYPGEMIRVEIIQDGSGSRTISGFSTGTNGFKLAGGAYTPTGTLNKRDVLTFLWDATDAKWIEMSRATNI